MIKVNFTYLFLFLVFIYCEKNKNFDKKNMHRQLSDIFIKKDSVTLNYPDSLFPERITGISYLKNHIYVLNSANNIKFPIVKFSREGEFIKTIGRKGHGPMEFDFTPTKICGINNRILAFSLTLNSFYLIVNDTIIRKKKIPIDSCSVSGISFISDDKILCSTKAWNKFGIKTKHHIFILNKKLEIIDSFINFPKDADLLTYGAFVTNQGLHKNDGLWITHHGYPPIIYLISYKNNKFKIDNFYKNQFLSNFIYAENPLNLKKSYDKQRISPMKFTFSFSRIDLIYKEGKYIVGKYFSFEKNGSFYKVYFFVLKNGKLIFEDSFKKENANYLLVYDGGIAQRSFYMDNDVLKVKLYLLKLNKRFFRQF